MDSSSNYNEFEGTDLDPSLDFDFEDEDNGLDDLIPLLGIAAAVAAVVGAILVLLGRRRKPTPQERLEDLLGDAGKVGKRSAKQVAQAVEDVHLGDLLEEALDRARGAAGAVAGADLSSVLDDALGKATKAASRFDLADTAKDVRKSAKKTASRVAKDIDNERVMSVVESIREKLGETIETVRSDYAPKAADAFKSDVLPRAQEAVEKVRDDVLPAAQERVGKWADDHDVPPQARKAASAAKAGMGSLGAVLGGLGLALVERVMDDVLPQAKKVGGRAMNVAREDVMPAAAHAAEEGAHRLREDVLPRVGEAASQAPDVLSDILKVARERVEDALEKAQPVATEVAEFGRHRAQDVTKGMGQSRNGVGGAITSARQGVTGAVSGAVGATTYAARETTGILLWLSVLGALILLAFVPDRDKQQELYDNVSQFVSEVREMWRDLQGDDNYESTLDTAS